MAEKGPQGESGANFAKRIDPKQESLSAEQLEFMRKVELAQWYKTAQKRGKRNIMTGLAIGAVVLGIYGYTFYSVSQEKFLDDLEEEAKIARARASKTSAN
ncbi:cytochrome c oxidase assembly factor 3 homolog, mitochondrial [Latimeria chalumnae]|uniref:Cytochrome c oxidase assembly factor 3 n=1 Tax=Latimeria chalumnae TaxID=7897 RepID=M3XJE3_LATCH|nr:PREDICTED: cytochrome c oxidase assembly factor 3 homolog, mitochondrial [Latimeria chalumnae]|eukprot:XP_005994077.1 PREDICTED: cytochrome c oxidase assembly factor 3 homolog, mitochondrial [Latimeria chalumnae]